MRLATDSDLIEGMDIYFRYIETSTPMEALVHEDYVEETHGNYVVVVWQLGKDQEIPVPVLKKHFYVKEEGDQL